MQILALFARVVTLLEENAFIYNIYCQKNQLIIFARRDKASRPDLFIKRHRNKNLMCWWAFKFILVYQITKTFEYSPLANHMSKDWRFSIQLKTTSTDKYFNGCCWSIVFISIIRIIMYFGVWEIPSLFTSCLYFSLSTSAPPSALLHLITIGQDVFS